MKILLILDVDPGDADEEHTTGLTAEAHERLILAVMNAGFSLTKGPDAEPSEITFT
jgi:hypothetical protein